MMIKRITLKSRVSLLRLIKLTPINVARERLVQLKSLVALKKRKIVICLIRWWIGLFITACGLKIVSKLLFYELASMYLNFNATFLFKAIIYCDITNKRRLL